MRRESHLVADHHFKRTADGSPLWADTCEYAVLAPEWAVRA